MDEEKSHIEYRGTDILNYFAGRLNAAEMHAMEKAALDDPFLAEAMEGYSMMPSEEVKTRLAALQVNFSTEENSKVISIKTSKKFTSWKAAAAVIIICASIALTYLFTVKGPDPNNPLAKVSPTTNAPKQPGATIAEDSIAIADTNKSNLQNPDPKVEVFAQKEAVAGDSGFIYRPPKASMEKPDDLAGGGYVENAESKAAAEVPTSNSVPYAQENAGRNAQVLSNKASSERAAKESVETKMTPVLLFTGQVLAADSTPLPFANVRITDDNVSTYADANGNFKLVSRDSFANIKISADGYKSLNLNVRADQMPERILMVPGDTPAEKKPAIRGKASAFAGRVSGVQLVDTLMNVRPVDGWENYDAYSANNLQTPANVRQEGIHGEVEVSFEVSTTGEVTNLKIEKSLCNSCDEEVLRLVKEGPKWTATNGKTGKGKIRVAF